MRKVLIIGYPFPLRKEGSPRLLGLARYLPEFGWQPIILTAPLEKHEQDYRIIETACRDHLHFWKKLLRVNPHQDPGPQLMARYGKGSRRSLMAFALARIGEIVNYPDADRGWTPFAVAAGKKLLKEEEIGAIISTSAPMTTHIIARKLKSAYGTPWIADLRDLWSQNHNYYYSRIRRWFDRRLERKVLSGANALVTVSQPWADKLNALHVGKATYSITNGFDPETLNEPPARLTQKFTLTYTGNIYARQHAPVKLFAALRDLLAEGALDPKDVEVRFYGNVAGWMKTEIELHKLNSVVNFLGQVSKDVAIQKQRESQVLFITKWNDPQERGAYSGKIFEYLAARRPILAIDGSNDVVTALLQETRAGVDAPTVQDIKEALQEFYRQYKEQGRVAYHGVDTECGKYSHREMAHRFSELLEGLATVPKVR